MVCLLRSNSLPDLIIYPDPAKRRMLFFSGEACKNKHNFGDDVCCFVTCALCWCHVFYRQCAACVFDVFYVLFSGETETKVKGYMFLYIHLFRASMCDVTST